MVLLRHGVHPRSSGLVLSQQQYTANLLKQSHMDLAKPLSIPMVGSCKLTKFDGSSLSDPSEYRSTIGALQYLTFTRPDIAYSVNKVYQFLYSPTSNHWAAVRRILWYLKGTIDHGLFFDSSSAPLSLQAFSDADWAGCPDDRWST
ncbi:PREDICTED: uncharacterized protein LOC109115498 [Nelumbo nucifera]|uniref:Uncharacterized protein LOC109115498 n=1 Tax=Nelumbo nucifera TaxID=4432 RepID=A0A1U8Q9B3_NELNU|nr:PREDICTED: uncharacterized protein LOC109115498 [Nelumbo nucifera]